MSANAGEALKSDAAETFSISYMPAPEVTRAKEDDMQKLMAQAITEMGCCVYVTVKVSDDYTMNEVVREIKRMRFVKFRLVDTMKAFAEVR